MYRSRWLLPTVLAIAAIAGLLVWHGRDTLPEAPEVPENPPSFPSHLALPAPTTVPGRVASQPASPHQAADESLASRVDALMATRDPAQAYLAYRLVRDCAEFNVLGDRLIFNEAELQSWRADSLPGYRGMDAQEKRQAAVLCSGMSERQRLARLDHLAIAAKAGVPGAAVAFAIEGPFGDPTALVSRPQDPLVQEWKSTALAQLTRAAESGADPGALAYLAVVYGGGSELAPQNLLLAYRYRMAAALIDAEVSGSDTSGRLQAVWDATVRDADPQQRAAELAAAQRIVVRARQWRARRHPTSG